MDTFDSPFGPVKLTRERWNHIILFHPDVRPYRKLLKATLSDPQIIRRSKSDSTVKICYRSATRNKYLAAVVKTNKRNFVLTTYLTHKIQHTIS